MPLPVTPRQHSAIVVTQLAMYILVNDTLKGIEQGIRTIARPGQIIPESNALVSEIGDTVAIKLIEGQSFYRQAMRFQADVVDLNRRTTNGWVAWIVRSVTHKIKNR